MMGISLQNREKVAGLTVLACISIIILTVVGLALLDVKIYNIEVVDRDLYVIVTDNGNVNISPDDILRFERSYSHTSGVKNQIEINKIYTNVGFIYLSSIDAFFSKGQQMSSIINMNHSLAWTRPNTTKTLLKSKSYAIGTPASWIPVVQSLVTIQNSALLICNISLLVLIFPIPRYFHLKY